MVRHVILAMFISATALLGTLAACGGGGGALISGNRLPAGYAYIATADSANRAVSGAVYQYSIGSDGSVAPLSIASVPAGVTPTSVVSDPSGRYVYVVNEGDFTISQYAVGAGGGLVALSPSAVRIASPFLFAGYSASIDPSGRCLYVVAVPRDPAGPSASITQYLIQNDGTLVALAQPYLQLTAFAYGSLVFDASGHNAYLPGATNVPGGVISQFLVNGDGALALLTPATVAAPQGTISIAVMPSGKTAYVLSTCVDTACDGQIERYTIDANGRLMPTGVAIPTGAHVNPIEFATNSTDSTAYLLTNAMGVDTNTGSVYQYAIDGTGTLVADAPASLSVASGAVAESIYGPNLYALSANAIGSVPGPPGGHVDHYVIGPDGLLTAVSTTTLAEGLPTSMTLVGAN